MNYTVFVGVRIISIHALRKESDEPSKTMADKQHISIHALRKESDHTRRNRLNGLGNFNPRSP